MRRKKFKRRPIITCVWKNLFLFFLLHLRTGSLNLLPQTSLVRLCLWKKKNESYFCCCYFYSKLFFLFSFLSVLCQLTSSSLSRHHHSHLVIPYYVYTPRDIFVSFCTSFPLIFESSTNKKKIIITIMTIIVMCNVTNKHMWMEVFFGDLNTTMYSCLGACKFKGQLIKRWKSIRLNFSTN